MNRGDSQSILSTNSTTSSSKYDTTLTDDNSSERQLICGETKDDFSFLFADVEASQRSVLLTRSSFDESFGFALQSYVFKRSSSDIFERITYVDYVSASSPAARSGLKRGDLVIAVNGCCVIPSSHAEIVASIMQSLHVTLVLVFKDVARIVSLSMRSIQLKFVLEEKIKELEALEEEEKEIEEMISANKMVIAEEEEEGLGQESILYELDEELKQVQKEECECAPGYRHIIRINSSNSMGSPQITRL